eukprot:3876271-Pleurochrysis_carterae.AAC.1
MRGSDKICKAPIHSRAIGVGLTKSSRMLGTTLTCVDLHEISAPREARAMPCAAGLRSEHRRKM